VNGRKRHLLVDTSGLVLAVVVHRADLPDQEGAKLVVADLAARYPLLRHIWADAAYRFTFRQWAQDTLGITVETVQRPPARIRTAPGVDPPPRTQFEVLPRRWVVERTFAWLGRYRRMSRDYEGLPETQRTMIHLCMIRLMVQRLATT
jgi:putative transposase